MLTTCGVQDARGVYLCFNCGSASRNTRELLSRVPNWETSRTGGFCCVRVPAVIGGWKKGHTRQEQAASNVLVLVTHRLEPQQLETSESLS